MFWVHSNPARVYGIPSQKWTKHIKQKIFQYSRMWVISHFLSQKVGKCFQIKVLTNVGSQERTFFETGKMQTIPILPGFI